jgi:Predicted membrane protein
MAALHPQIVHFTIVLVIVGVAFRLLSLAGKPAFAGPAAATLLILAAISSVVSVRSGTAAHGPVERVPGARSAVVEHEEWGERTQNILLVLGVIELAGLALRRSPRVRLVHAAAALVGLVGVYSVYETAEHGGELVYSYAGGIGLRSGNPRDVERLLLAGYYHQALQDRKAGYFDRAHELIAAASKRFPADVEVQLLAAESLIVDLREPQQAVDALASIDVPDSNRVLRTRKATLQADAFEALGQKDKAIAALQPIVDAAPNARIQQRIDGLKR